MIVTIVIVTIVIVTIVIVTIVKKCGELLRARRRRFDGRNGIAHNPPLSSYYI